MTSAELVPLIHATPYQCILYTAGGGSGIFPLLLRNGGGTATLLDGGVPLAPRAVARLLNMDPSRSDLFPKAVSVEVAHGLAMSAFLTATEEVEDTSVPVLGVGCTASLAKAGPERTGRVHEVYISVQRRDLSADFHFIWSPESKSRVSEEEDLELMLLHCLGWATDVSGHVPFDPEVLQTTEVFGSNAALMPDLLLGNIPYVAFDLSLELEDLAPTIFKGVPPEKVAEQPFCLLPGSFRPFHDGHRKMRQVASAKTGLPCHLELSIRNAAKPPMTYIDIRRRLSALEASGAGGTLLLTNVGTFAAKSSVFRDCTFAIGYDTALRLADPKYYSGEDGRDRAYAALAQHEARFLCFGRQTGPSRLFGNISTASFDEKSRQFFRDHATEISAGDFAEEFSSTALRISKSSD